MRTGRAMGMAVLLWALQAKALLYANVPVFQHDPVQEKAYLHQEVLPELIPLVVILCALLAGTLIAAAVRKAHRGAAHPSASESRP